MRAAWAFTVCVLLLSVADNPAPVQRPLRVFRRVLSEAPRRGLALLLLLMAVGSALEGVGPGCAVVGADVEGGVDPQHGAVRGGGERSR